MSGHSKWSTIKHKKGAADVKNKALARSVDAAKRGQEIHEDVLILDDAALDDELRGGPR